MRNLAKHKTYVVQIGITKTDSSGNRYARIIEAFEIANAKRKYFDCKNEATEWYGGQSSQMAAAFMERQGYRLSEHLSDHPNLVVIKMQKLKTQL